MERAKYDEEYLRKIAKTHTTGEIAKILNIEKHKIENYCWRHNIKPKGYNPNKIRNARKRKIGDEIVKPDGMVIVKTSDKKWEYKQRKIYEDYYGVKLPNDFMVVFLDQDRTNFDINNLMAVKSEEMNYLKNKGILTKNRELNFLSLLNARLYYKTKEKEYDTSKKRSI